MEDSDLTVSGSFHGNADALSRRQYDSEVSHGSTPHNDSTQVTTEPHQHPENIHSVTLGETLEYKLTYVTDKETVCSIDDPESLTDRSVDVAARQRKDSSVNPYIEYLEKGSLPSDTNAARRVVAEIQDFVLQDGVLYHYYYPRGKGHQGDRQIKQLVVPSCLYNDILIAYHDSILGGHQGIDRTYNSIRQKYFWPRMFAHIETYVKTCTTCQRIKVNRHAQRAPLQPLPIGEVFSRLHIDILGPLKTSPAGYKYVLLIVDSFSKWCEAFPLKTQDADEVARILYSEIICRYGAPSSLLSDRGAQFMSKLIQQLCNIFQITKVQTSSYPIDKFGHSDFVHNRMGRYFVYSCQSANTLPGEEGQTVFNMHETPRALRCPPQ